MSFFNSISFRLIHIADVVVAAGIFLTAGDLQAQQVTPSLKNIIRNFAAIIDSLQSHHIVPVIQSTLFVGAKYPHAREKNT